MKIFAKVLSTLISLAAGWLGTKLISASWHKATGERPPSLTHPDKQQQTTIGKLLVFAVISGASASVIQALTKRWTRGLEARASAH